MARYTVPFTTWANTSVEIEVPDDVTDPEQIAELAWEQMGEEGGPTLCHQCTGTRNGGGLEIGDEWEPARFDGKPSISRLD